MAEIHCDICDNRLNDCDEYKILCREMHDDFLRICYECIDEGEG